MKIAIIQGTTQVDKNELPFNVTRKFTAPYHHQILNFGVDENEEESYSYTEVAILIALLINSQVVDFVITGCSSGQGMNLACNTLPGLLSGYIPTPQDAFLFGRINGGNVASLPLGLGFGWLGELNLEYTLEKLFDGEFGIGFPKDVAERKVKEINRIKEFNRISKYGMIEVMERLDAETQRKVFSKVNVIDYIIHSSKDKPLVSYLVDKRTKFNL
ncbi:RpiB/LacA/LacB family sugar-phosphate isomerase [Streptococcus gallinaceus]|uniref:Ribose 5-phosphate isomerase RpiB n=1 Tax=Streptococcus gallinaceus TaxID=165758 RepID=A0ABV2JJE3_9STRE|nr:RpiB/LacA/LacB family sugar-phosphate isomerase [Streptococcus gallinaceus]MCP1639021.1 ribose 5-phosphate isomerase RpiB [Streptococcus gallinaceus]MCP1769735.1 ribose 5-phosphate isomerase RpiB [Streptococcus gallinaceus]